MSSSTLPEAAKTRQYQAVAGQLQLWLFQQMYPISTAYNMQGSINIRAELRLDDARLRHVMSILIARHPALRTVFDQVDGQLMQVVRAEVVPELVVIETADADSLQEAIKEFSAKPFDLKKGPLFRMLGLRCPGAPISRCIWMIHHIVCDGVSMNILSREFLTLLKSVMPILSDLPQPPPIEFIDRAFRQAGSTESADAKRYWLNLLENRPPRLRLPYDFSNAHANAVESECAIYTTEIPQTVGVLLDKFAISSKTTPFTVLLSAFTVFLANVSGDQIFLLGVPVSGRSRSQMRGVVGFFANTVVIKADVRPNQSFASHVNLLRAQVMSALKYQDYPFGRLVDELGAHAKAHHFPIVSVFFNMLKLSREAAELAPPTPGHRVQPHQSKLDLEWRLLKSGSHTYVECHYRSGLFHPETISYLANEYVRLLASVLSEPNASMQSLSLLPKPVSPESAAVSVPANPEVPFNCEASRTPIECFEAIVAKHGQKTAVQDGTVFWTYADLDIQRRGIAQALRIRGIRAGSHVALLFNNNTTMVAAILGVLSVGATYIPLDPQDTEGGLRRFLEDGAVDTLLIDPAHLDLSNKLLRGAFNTFVMLCPDVTASAALAMDFEAITELGPDLPAYILYTPGSTGTPKGVMQSNANLLYHIHCYVDKLGIVSSDRLMLASCYCLHAAALDIFGALLSGGELCVMDARQLPASEVLRRINWDAVTIFHSTPTMLRHLLLDSDVHSSFRLKYVRLMVLGGGAVGPEEVALWRSRTHSDVMLVNCFGSPESTLALQHFIKHGDARIPYPVPLGHAVGSTRVDLMMDNEIQEHCFASGEIVVRSDHVALSYWGNPEETSRAFGVDGEGRRFYRTGQYGRRWVDGSIRPLASPETAFGKIDGQASTEMIRTEVNDLLSDLANLHIRLEVTDEGKLKCHAPSGTLSNELRKRIQSCKVGLTALLTQKRALRPSRPLLLRHPAGIRIPLSFSQERIWFMEQYSGGSTFQNMPIALQFTGALDTPRLRGALCALLQRHELLRAVVCDDEAGPTLKIKAEPTFDFLEEDWASSGNGPLAPRLGARIQEEAAQAFDLRRGPLLRATLLKLSQQKHVLVLTMHHIVSDGWSVGVLLQDIARLYRGEFSDLPFLEFSYSDYAAWQRHPETGQFLEVQLEYWKSLLLPHPPTLELPFDKPAVMPALAEGARERLVLPRTALARAEKFARSHEVTLFALLFSALKILLYRWTQETDLTVGTVSAGRNHHALENVVGCFINSLAIRTRLDPHEQLTELIRAVSRGLSQAYQHQDCPFEKVIEAVNPPRKAGANPLFNVVLLLQNFPVPDQFSEGIEVEAIPAFAGGVNLDLRFLAGNFNDEFVLSCEYDKSRFKPETVRLLLDALEGVISWMIEKPERLLEDAHHNAPPALERLCANVKPRRHLVVASTFTAEPIRSVLAFWMENLHGEDRVSFAPYAQVFQSLLDPKSELARNLDTNILLLHLVDWMGQGVANVHLKHDATRKACADFIAAFSEFHLRSKATNIVVVTPEVWGEKVDDADELIAELRCQLKEAIDQLPGAYLIDGADALRIYPVEQVADEVTNRIGHVPYSQEYFTSLGTFLSRKIAALDRQPYKVIAVDCDNTLWGGVCAEVGPQAVDVSRGYLFLQEFLVDQHAKGMLICLCSKNQEGDVRAVFEHHPAMALTMDHIAAARFNWQPKSSNLQSLASELNLSIDSFIFLDDNPIECKEVETACPSVLTLNMPDSSDEFEGFLINTWEFDRPTVTREAAKRGDYYRQSRDRQSMQQASLSFEEFLEKLELKVEIRPLSPQELERAAEMTQRTNQFNLSTVRRNVRQLDTLLRSCSLEGVAVKVSDRFGDYGLTGLALYAANGRTLVVDTLLLSCRVLGRRVEHHLAHHLSEVAQQHDCSHVLFEYRPTERNQPILDFLTGQFGAWSRKAASSMVFEVPVEKCRLTAAQSAGTPQAIGGHTLPQ